MEVEKTGVLAMRNDVAFLRTPEVPERGFSFDLDIPARAEVVDIPPILSRWQSRKASSISDQQPVALAALADGEAGSLKVALLKLAGKIQNIDSLFLPV